ncbi:nucleoside hydrolase [Paenibacillus eucommiae]|uniref:Purine nucleosidase/pyrimidine-specific ribonucleoside hydrolase n=1 Tax=Paenibacillus eucommiae TaxID=1355755 RepID=A0ABS4J9W1_9BACL|nr:nucleoside hydrolase [Paenibacillus eucommiae]MBP1996638.1 purine nucleosidase/pyrimidine-specific ribonucleoside hydrolase [Paenibacillus eucommiae]
MTVKKVIIDCDPGMDDSLALILACKSKELDVKAITTVSGNYHVDITSVNALKTMELIDRTDIPVARGMAKPLVRPLASDPFTHGSDGQAEAFLPAPTKQVVDMHAADVIIETVKKYPNELYLIALAPLSNIALALMKCPEIKDMIKGIYAIAGAYGLNKYSSANATGDNPQSEWNVYVDPEAAEIIFSSGIPIMAIGLDVATHFDVNFSEEDLELLRKSDKKEAKFLLNMIEFVTNRGFESYCVLIDSMAVAAAIDETLIQTIKGRVGVETKGNLTLGMTILDTRHHHTWNDLPEIQVAAEADYKRFNDLVLERILL